MTIFSKFNCSFPCLWCSEPTSTALCSACQKDFLSSPSTYCHCCAIPLEQPSNRCGQCLSSPPWFDHTPCLYLYQPPLSRLIKQFKEQCNWVSARALSELFITGIHRYYRHSDYPMPEAICPIPLHWTRRLKRGFNQSLYLATALGKAFELPLYHDLHRPKRDTPQKTLTRRQRLTQPVFHANTPVPYQHIALVDDVMTTGATVNAAAKALKKAGVKEVSIWVLARTDRS